MKRVARLLTGFLCICLLAAMLSGCDRGKEPSVDEPSVISVYATFYPFYALTELLIADIPDIQLNCLVQPQDGCLRNYQLSDWDLALLGSVDAVISGGRGLESFESVLYALGEEGPAVSAVLYNMELEQQAAANTQEDSDSHWLSANPHIYMSVEGAINIAQRIAANLMLIDPEHEQQYQENLAEAENRLKSLLEEMQNELALAENEAVIVMNEALLYSAQDYKLDVDLCYDRESGEGLSGVELESCLETLGGSDARVILIEKQAPQAFCEALEAAGYRLARMDALSTRRASEGAEGYFEAQRANAQALRNAFTEVNSASEKVLDSGENE